jgi:2-polyprenyl-6-methoxyphenol hydroxylase-like FAD-dependent oxidoreductase
VAGCAVTGAAPAPDGVLLSSTRGAVRARWVIGADGPRSVMRRLGGFAMRRRGYPDRYVMGDATDATAFGDRAVLFLEPGGVVESFPLPGGLRRWVVHRGRNAVPAGPRELAAIVRARTGAEVDAATIAGTSAFGVRHVWAADPVRGRIVLVGDAAHEISPIGGQGMTLGWLDAAQLADALAGVLAGDGPAALAEYRRAAARRHWMTARQACFNTVMGRPRRGAVLSARNAVIRGLTLPRFERGLARAFTMAAPAGTAREAQAAARS